MISIKNWQASIEELKEKKVEIPRFNVEELKDQGKKAPVWIHFGGGNLYRGFHAELAQRLADQNELASGVIVCETFDNQVVEKAYHEFNNNILEVVMSEDGTLVQRILAATADSFYCNPSDAQSYEQVIRYFENLTLQFTTFTITEKGYGLTDTTGGFTGIIQSDINNGPEKPAHTMSIVAALLYKRYLAGKLPIAMVSTDNFSQNGQRFQDSILTIANAWLEKGHVNN